MDFLIAKPSAVEITDRTRKFYMISHTEVAYHQQCSRYIDHTLSTLDICYDIIEEQRPSTYCLIAIELRAPKLHQRPIRKVITGPFPDSGAKKLLAAQRHFIS